MRNPRAMAHRMQSIESMLRISTDMICVGGSHAVLRVAEKPDGPRSARYLGDCQEGARW